MVGVLWLRWGGMSRLGSVKFCPSSMYPMPNAVFIFKVFNIFKMRNKPPASIKSNAFNATETVSTKLLSVVVYN